MILLYALESAEDHRYRLHFGIDPIAIIRSAFNIVIRKRLEGASTIEQQYVRTCTGHKAISFIRKLEEASIAVLLSLKANKTDIAYSYLTYAYYGYRLNGYKSAILAFSESENQVELSQDLAASVVSLLKRPKPEQENPNWKIAHHRRVSYILARQRGVNNCEWCDS